VEVLLIVEYGLGDLLLVELLPLALHQPHSLPQPADPAGAVAAVPLVVRMPRSRDPATPETENTGCPICNNFHYTLVAIENTTNYFLILKR
jgi:hypothetical protein